jgi:hypothetical protein
MRRITFPLTMVTALIAAGCHSYKPLPHPASAVGKTVKVQFAVPRSLVAVRGASGDSVFSEVSALRGRVVDAVGDTMHVVLQRITDSALDHPVPPGMTVTIVPAPSVAVDVLAVDEGKTAALAGGTLVAFTVVLLAALLVAVASIGGPN